MKRKKKTPTQETAPKEPTRRRWVRTALLVYALAGLAAYANSFHASFHFDDLTTIVNEPTLHLEELTAGGLWRAATAGGEKAVHRPLALASFALNWLVGEEEVFGYHVVNLLLHILTAWLAALAVLALAPRAGFEGRAGPVAFLAGLIFLLHPVQTQATTYIVQRMALLAAFFWLLALLTYLRGRRGNGPAAPWSLLVALFLGLAFLSKETAVTFVPAAVLLEWLILRPDRSEVRRAAALLAPALVLTVVASAWGLGAFSGKDAYLDKALPEQTFTVGERLASEPRVLADYASLVLFPFPSRLNADPNPPVSTAWDAPPSTLPAILFVILWIAYAVRVRRRRPAVACAVLFFLLALAPESTFIKLALAYEHRLYLPLLAPAALAAGAFTAWAGDRRRLWTAAVAVLAVLLGTGTFLRNRVWRDDLSLWQDTVEKSPGKARVNYNYGNALFDLKRYDEAEARYRRALAIEERIPKVYNNLGRICQETRRLPEAEKAFRRAVELDPTFAMGWSNLGNTLKRLGRLEEAEAALRRAVEVEPDSPEILSNLGNVLKKEGRGREALALYRRALKLDPGYAKGWNNLGAALDSLGEKDEAFRAFLRAVELDPDYADGWYNVGLSRLERGEKAQAAEALGRARALGKRLPGPLEELLKDLK